MGPKVDSDLATPLSPGSIRNVKKKIKLLEAKKETLFLRVQRAYDLCKLENINTDSESRDYLLVRCANLEETRKEYNEIIESINDMYLGIEPDYTVNFQAITAFDDIYVQIQVKLKQLNLSTTSSPSVTVQTRSTAPHVKLPPLTVPEFSGKTKDWPIYYQSFKNMFIDNPTLTDEDRMRFLGMSLKDKAKSFLSGLPILSENFTLVWEALKERYEDQRALASSYLDTLMNFKAPSRETFSSLDSFLQNFVAPAQAFNNLKISDKSDFLLLHLALSRLHSDTVKQFESYLTNISNISTSSTLNTASNSEASEKTVSLPTFAQLIKFIREHAKILERQPVSKQFVENKKPANYGNSYKPSHSLLVNNQHSKSCAICGSKQKHPAYQCPELKKLSPYDRYLYIKKKGWCINCMSDFHKTPQCKSTRSCFCGARHHSLLHFSDESSRSYDDQNVNTQNSVSKNICNANNSETVPEPEQVLAHCSCNTLSNKKNSNVSVLLATAQVLIKDSSKRFHQVRTLLDSCSEPHIITLECCNKLRLPKRRISTSIKGVGSAALPVRFMTELTFYSKYDKNCSFTIEALVTDALPHTLPSTCIPIENISHIKDLKLADETLLTPGKIDLIIGASLYPLIMNSNKIIGPPNTPSAFDSCLGYVVMGSAQHNFPLPSENRIFCTTIEDNKLNNLVSKFWSMEDIPSPSKSSLEDEECENIFKNTVKRLDNGRYSVHLPFKQSPSELGKSKYKAVQHFLSLEKRLESQPEIRLQYHEFLLDFLKQNHMSISDNDVEEGCYLPHHYVLKPDSTSTKLRVVWNASSLTSSGLSLNSILHTGPKLHSDIRSILLRFRAFLIAVTADIRQMYRQILINNEDIKYQKFIFRFSSDDDLATYTLNTVSFGVKPAPYLALRCLQQLASDYQITWPQALFHILNFFYIDDYCQSFASLNSALCTYNNLITMFNSAGFELVKWCSSSDEFLKELPDHIKESRGDLSLLPNDSLKILGLRWLSYQDCFIFQVNVISQANTKREILSLLARIFDPLGFLSPVTVYIKLLLHQLWCAKVSWDQILDSNSSIIKGWTKFLAQLPLLDQFKIPRFIGLSSESTADLIGFCDSSSKAYGCVIYVRVPTCDGYKISLLISRTKIAPKSSLTIPRLELCAASLLARLFVFVIDSYKDIFNFNNLFAFSDSAIVLHWISSIPSRWTPFVAHRVRDIQSVQFNLDWRHVKGTDNPADCLSRGLCPKDLLQYPNWLSGPHWLQEDTELWPQSNIILNSNDICEGKPSLVVNTVSNNNEISFIRFLIDKFSSYKILIGVFNYILKWKNRLPRYANNNLNIDLQPETLSQAEILILKFIQKEHFSLEYDLIKEKKPCSSNIRKLNPFIDEKYNLIRVGGRLTHSDLSFAQKFPILLPKRDHINKIIIHDYHVLNFHTGPSLVLSLIRQKFWILGARSLIRLQLQSCNTCFRYRPIPTFPMMGNLPSPRVTQCKPFLHTGVDYAGPFYVTPYKKRGIKTIKVYLCLFVCLSVKAIHIEVASDLSTHTFLNALKRFISRRGPIHTLYSDCGTNFIGARSYLNEMYTLVNTSAYINTVRSELNSHRINFKMNPPAAPHHGGIWERQIRSVKTHLFKVTHGHTLTLEEFNTVIVQIEALLNSRPLGILSSDPSDPSPLTPSRFLMQIPLSELPNFDVSSTPDNLLSRFEVLDRLVKQFWRRWHLEYLHTLQTREKWNTNSNPIKVGMIVILMQDSTPPLQWPLAVVEQIFPGQDGVVRVASVRVGESTYYRRPVTKLCPLPTQ